MTFGSPWKNTDEKKKEEIERQLLSFLCYKKTGNAEGYISHRTMI